MKTFILVLGIGLGGAVGALIRHLIGYLAHNVIGLPEFVGVMIINVLGCFLIGILFFWIEYIFNRDLPSRLSGSRLSSPLTSRGWWPQADPTAPVVKEFKEDIKAQLISGVLITGLLGGMTTFSLFSLISLQLEHGGHHINLLINVLGSVALGLFATYLGLKTGQWVVLRGIKGRNGVPAA